LAKFSIIKAAVIGFLKAMVIAAVTWEGFSLDDTIIMAMELPRSL
jgi:DNA-directed RNA polymerase beta subunit